MPDSELKEETFEPCLTAVSMDEKASIRLNETESLSFGRLRVLGIFLTFRFHSFVFLSDLEMSLRERRRNN